MYRTPEFGPASSKRKGDRFLGKAGFERRVAKTKAVRAHRIRQAKSMVRPPLEPAFPKARKLHWHLGRLVQPRNAETKSGLRDGDHWMSFAPVRKPPVDDSHFTKFASPISLTSRVGTPTMGVSYRSGRSSRPSVNHVNDSSKIPGRLLCQANGITGIINAALAQ